MGVSFMWFVNPVKQCSVFIKQLAEERRGALGGFCLWDPVVGTLTNTELCQECSISSVLRNLGKVLSFVLILAQNLPLVVKKYIQCNYEELRE